MSTTTTATLNDNTKPKGLKAVLPRVKAVAALASPRSVSFKHAKENAKELLDCCKEALYLQPLEPLSPAKKRTENAVATEIAKDDAAPADLEKLKQKMTTKDTIRFDIDLQLARQRSERHEDVITPRFKGVKQIYSLGSKVFVKRTSGDESRGCVREYDPATGVYRIELETRVPASPSKGRLFKPAYASTMRAI